MFRELEVLPKFEMMDVGFGSTYRFSEKNSEMGTSNDNDALEAAERRGNELWRKYRLSAPDFETDILEVFPSRTMFT